MTTLIPKYDLMNGGSTPTGAINRPINQKLSDLVSIKDFGAVGDGTTDDTTAIQNAINSGLSLLIPQGTFLISSTLTINLSNTSLFGEDVNTCIIKASGTFPIFTFLSDSSVTDLARINFKNFTLLNGSHGIYASRTTGALATIERFWADNLNFQNQTAAGMYFTGSSLGYYVNKHTNCAFYYCTQGLLINQVFSCNLIHTDLCRFEGLSNSGVGVSTTNNECANFTISRSRFEATSGTVSPIYVLGGAQSLVISENYFENNPSPQININAGSGLNISTLIQSNFVSSNLTTANVVTFASQCFDAQLLSNSFRELSTSTINGDSYCQNLVASGNGQLNFVGFNGTLGFTGSAVTYDLAPTGKYEKQITHTGTFTDTYTLPQIGTYLLNVVLRDNGDISLGAVATILINYWTGATPILDCYTIHQVDSPTTTNIGATVSSSGVVTLTYTQSSSTSRTAYLSYSFVNQVNVY
jgi:hypothetical protein